MLESRRTDFADASNVDCGADKHRVLNRDALIPHHLSTTIAGAARPATERSGSALVLDEINTMTLQRARVSLTDHEFSCEGPVELSSQHNRGPAPVLAVYHDGCGPA